MIRSVRRAVVSSAAALLRRLPSGTPGAWRLEHLVVRQMRAIGPSLRPRVVATRDGFLMWADPGEWVGQYVYATGRYEESTVALMSRLLGPGDSVVDVGANVGYLTLLAARLVGPTGSVIAFEPLPQARAWLERNVALNGFAHVTIRGEAVADRSSTVSLVVGPAHHTSTSSVMAAEHGGDHIEVACTRLDDAVAEKARVTLIKIDVEGAEHLVLLGATRVLGARVPHLIVELNGPEVAGILAGYGYTGQDLEGRPLGPYAGQTNAYFTLAAGPPGAAGRRAPDVR